MNNLLIVGAGQFGQVTKEIAQSLNKFNKIDFLDDNSELALDKVDNYKKYKGDYNYAIVAIGNSGVRKELLNKLKKIYKIDSIISPNAYVSDSAIIEEGSIVEPTAFINANATIKEGCIICAGAIINHNSNVNSFCHINCGAIIKSNSIIEEGTKVDYGEIR